MNPHEKTILLIANLGMSNKKVSEITQKSLGTINQTKVKKQTRYKFTELDYNRIIEYINYILWKQTN
jgi:hypothetical protein